MLRGKRILFINGNEPLYDGVTETLTCAGASVAETRTAEDALRLLEQETFDLLVVNLNLPAMGAYKLCKELEGSARHARTPIVPASANPFINSINITVCSNVVDFLRKPFTCEELVEVLTRVFSGKPAFAGRPGRRPAE